jgi:hypothetical protein
VKGYQDKSSHHIENRHEDSELMAEREQAQQRLMVRARNREARLSLHSLSEVCVYACRSALNCILSTQADA